MMIKLSESGCDSIGVTRWTAVAVIAMLRWWHRHHDCSLQQKLYDPSVTHAS